MDHGRYPQFHHQYGAAGLSIDSGGGTDRFPQWSLQETRDFLIIRAEMDPTFMETKRNKILWEVISTRMQEKGYTRSPEQCKGKWKNLVTRYKGCETMEAEGMRQQFPFYNEMQMIFNARMQRMLWMEADGGGGAAATSSKKKAMAAAQFSTDEEDDENVDDVSVGGGGSTKKKKKKMKGKMGNPPAGESSENSIVSGVKEMMGEFMKQQMEMEMQSLKAYEEREEERRVKEMEWRQTMEALENEKMMMDRRWREMEEERKIREEARAEKRDTLMTALLNKLRRQGM